MPMNTSHNIFILNTLVIFAKIELATLRVVNNYMKPKELKKALLIVAIILCPIKIRMWNVSH